MLARTAAIALLACLPWLGEARAQDGKVPPPLVVPPTPAPTPEPTSPVIAWGLAFMLPVAILVVVCMPSRKG